MFSTHHHYGQSRYPKGWARFNRSRYVRPHQGQHEIDRRRHHEARDLANQLDRAEAAGQRISRRGLVAKAIIGEIQ